MPGKKASGMGRWIPTVSGASLQVCGEEVLQVDFVQSQGGVQAKHGGGELSAPDGTAAVVVFASDDRSAQCPFGRIIVWGDSLKFKEGVETIPVCFDAIENATQFWMNLGIGEQLVGALADFGEGVGQSCLGFALFL